MKNKNCPICSNKSQSEYAPFCSDKCANKDLGNWLSGRYYIPGEKINDETIYDSIDLSDILKKDH
ncbi:MAG: DNA gyrase inhibitor YacG [Rhizobiales bacterium]|nr:DNA gyrase inhibitor YacG [Hyphomicrobiales bacterium]MBL6770119.1 DNA gyrase inhibitor YacG [Hyphomicrobiales bacterium]